MKTWNTILVCCAAFGLCLPAPGASPSFAQAQDGSALAKSLLSRAGVSRGICAAPNCGEGGLALAVARASGMFVHAMDANPEAVAAAQGLADGEKLLGVRMAIEAGSPRALPYADNYIDVLLIADGGRQRLGELSAAEILRVLRPLGAVFLETPGKTGDAEKWLRDQGFRDVAAADADSPSARWALGRKPALKGAAEWRHWANEPDNNPVSGDTIIKAPYLTQWLGGPHYIPMPVITTTAAGRLFVAAGHIAHHNREVPSLYSLTARNAYNGQTLWERRLPDGYLVHRSAFIATPETFYLMTDDGCLKLDPETGVEQGRVRIPGVGGDWCWMALQGDTLYVLAAKKDPPVKTTIVNDRTPGWSWGKISPGYLSDRGRVPWGFGETLAAYDLKTNKRVWKHTEEKPIDSRGLGMLDGRFYFYAPESKLACLDAATGEYLWSNQSMEALAPIEATGARMSSTPGWKSECMLLCTPQALFIQGQKRNNIVAFSAEDGSLLWSRQKKRNNPNLAYLDGKLVIAEEETEIVEPLTGKLIKGLGFTKRTCARLTACSDALFCRAMGEGMGRYDRAAGKYIIDRSFRPGCNDGAIPANGLLYVGPFACDCSLELVGTVMLGPARDFDFSRKATNEERLQKGTGDLTKIKPLKVDERDWPTHRANNQRAAASKAPAPQKAKPLWRIGAGAGVRFSPVVSAGGLMFAGGDDGVIRCLDAASGKEAWRYVTAGPVRLPPSISRGRAYAGSADGYVYALEAATGRLLWRFRAAPADRRIMVYGRFCSTWPVNSGVLVEGGVVYAAAGIVDSDGTYVYALDAETGALKWENNQSGHYRKDEREGISAQGDLAVAQGQLWLAGSNILAPARYDLNTGEFRPNAHLTVAGRPADTRGADVVVFKNRYLLNGGRSVYSENAEIVSGVRFKYREANAKGEFAGVDIVQTARFNSPENVPLPQAVIPPVFDDEVFVMPLSNYGYVTCWSANEFEGLLRAGSLQLHHNRALGQDGAISSRVRQGLLSSANQAFEDQLRRTSRWGVKNTVVLALAGARDAILCAQKSAKDNNAWELACLDKQTGKARWTLPLPSAPSLNGLSLDRQGRAIVALKDGGLVCFGRAE